MREEIERYLRINHKNIWDLSTLSPEQLSFLIMTTKEYLKNKKNYRSVSRMNRIVQCLDNQGIKLPKLKTRKGEIVEERQIVMYFLRKETGLSYIKIGKYCGNFNQGTVLNAEICVSNRMEYDREFRKKINSIIL